MEVEAQARRGYSILQLQVALSASSGLEKGSARPHFVENCHKFNVENELRS